MKRWMVFSLVFMLAFIALFGRPAGGLAQDAGQACPVIVETALLMAEGLCDQTGRNEVCYGHTLLSLESRPDVSIEPFTDLGDRAPVAAIQRLQAGPMDAATGDWGVALMRLQANLPDTLPGQNVTVVVFGDVTLTAAPGAEPAPVTVIDGTVVVSEPSLAGTPIADPLTASTLVAEGRLADNLWVLIRLPDGRTGWVMSGMVSSDYSMLPVVDSSGSAASAGGGQGTFNAFYFTTGLADAPCAAAPDSGLLVQTPEGAAEVLFRINDVDVRLGSTAYFRAQPNGDMTVSVLEGQAVLTAFDVTQTAGAGSQVHIPLDESGAAAGAPLPPEPYDAAMMQVLPLSLLEQTIVPPPPMKGGGTAGGTTGGGTAANLIQNGDFSNAMAGWTLVQECQQCGMQPFVDQDVRYGDYLAWQRDTSGGRDGGAIWAQQPLNIDMATCANLRIAFDVRVDWQSLTNSGWWTDEHGGNGEYPVTVRLAFRPAYQGSTFDWARGFLIFHDGTTHATNYMMVPPNQWSHYEADVLSPAEWVDAFGNVLTNPGVLTDIFVGGSGWDFTGAIDNITLTGTGCVVGAR